MNEIHDMCDMTFMIFIVQIRPVLFQVLVTTHLVNRSHASSQIPPKKESAYDIHGGFAQCVIIYFWICFL